MDEKSLSKEEDLDGVQVIDEVMTLGVSTLETTENVVITSKPPSWLLISGICIIIAGILIIYFKLRKR